MRGERIKKCYVCRSDEHLIINCPENKSLSTPVGLDNITPKTVSTVEDHGNKNEDIVGEGNGMEDTSSSSDSGHQRKLVNNEKIYDASNQTDRNKIIKPYLKTKHFRSIKV